MTEERQFSLSRLTLMDEINYFLKTGKLNEGFFKSYDGNWIAGSLRRHFGLGNKSEFYSGFVCGYVDIEEITNSEAVVIVLLLPRYSSDSDDIERFMKACGWRLATSYPAANNGYFTYVYEKDRQEKELTVPRFLYHILPQSKVKKVLKIGLCPRSGNKIGKHIERVYLLYEEPSRSLAIAIADSLYGVKYKRDRGVQYAMLKIDTTKIKQEFKIFGDPNFYQGVWTFSNIPPEAISVIYDDI